MTTDNDKLEINTKELEVRDDGTAETTLIDGIHGLSILDGFIVVNLTRTTVPSPTLGDAREPYIDTVERLAMPINAFVRIAEYFGKNLARMKDEGMIVPSSKE